MQQQEQHHPTRIELVFLDQHDNGQMPVWLFGAQGGRVRGLIADIGHDGARLVTGRFDAEPPECFELWIQPRPDHGFEPFAISARRIWSSEGGATGQRVTGCHFEPLEERLRGYLDRVLGRLREMEVDFLRCELRPVAA